MKYKGKDRGRAWDSEEADGGIIREPTTCDRNLSRFHLLVDFNMVFPSRVRLEAKRAIERESAQRSRLSRMIYRRIFSSSGGFGYARSRCQTRDITSSHGHSSS
jgi:hypothetical protein